MVVDDSAPFHQRFTDLETRIDQRFTGVESTFKLQIDAVKDMAQAVSGASKDAVKAAFDASGSAISAALIAINQTVAAFQEATKEHFKTINGLQAKLDKQAETFATKDALFLLEKRLLEAEAQNRGAGSTWLKIGAVVGPLMALAALAIQIFVTLPKLPALPQ